MKGYVARKGNARELAARLLTRHPLSSAAPELLNAHLHFRSLRGLAMDP